MKRFCILALAALLLLVTSTGALASGLLPGKGPMEAYEELVAAFELGDYAAARKILKENQLVELGIKDAREYSLYLNALDCMEKGSYALAANLFGSLTEDEIFRDSKVLHAYCSGRTAEASGDYAAAVEHYILSASYGDSVTRMSNCMALQDSSKVASADTLYQQGLSLQDMDLLEQALAMYVEIGDVLKTTQCQQALLQLKKQQAYEKALQQYESALSEGNLQGMKSAAAAFTALGRYSDSAKYVELIQQQLSELQRVLTFMVKEVSSTGFKLQWTDSAPQGSQYTVSWVPVHGGEKGSLSTSELTAELTGLIPGTEYELALTASGTLQHQAVLSICTAPADAYGSGFYISRAALIGVKRTYISLASLSSLLENKPQVLEYLPDNRIELADSALSAQSMVYCYAFTYCQDKQLQDPVDTFWVLRTKSAGVYASKSMTYDALPASGRLFIELDTVLDPLYQACHEWPREDCTIELYINGKLAAEGVLILGK